MRVTGVRTGLRHTAEIVRMARRLSAVSVVGIASSSSAHSSEEEEQQQQRMMMAHTVSVAAGVPLLLRLILLLLVPLAAVQADGDGEGDGVAFRMVDGRGVLRYGNVKLWGSNSQGQLGQGDTVTRGNGAGEMGSALPNVDLGSCFCAAQVHGAEGGTFACAVSNGSSTSEPEMQIKCWGSNSAGQLGQGDTASRGNSAGTMGDALTAIDLGSGFDNITDFAVGAEHVCAVHAYRWLKCWGDNGDGQLGYEDTNSRGDGPGEMGSVLSNVDLGSNVAMIGDIDTGAYHTCVVLRMLGSNGTGLKCWGRNNNGQLGYGDTDSRGDGLAEMGNSLPFVDLGAGPGVDVVEVQTGGFFTCAMLSDNSTKCFGSNSDGQLGLGDSDHRGDSQWEMGANLSAVDVGTGLHIVSLTSNDRHSCAILDNQALKCWGYGGAGQLGYEDSTSRGASPGEMGNMLPFVNVGTNLSALTVTGSSFVSCATTNDSSVKCWGLNTAGQLGYGDTSTRGDDAGEMGDSLPFVLLGDPVACSLCTASPTLAPTTSPTNTPTTVPTANPTAMPTLAPSDQPTTPPTPNPTQVPTQSPSNTPTRVPTQNPSNAPTTNPTAIPSTSPTQVPTQNPSSTPTANPTAVPTRSPTQAPTQSPSSTPTITPTAHPSWQPTMSPSTPPTQNPSNAPTWAPSDSPSWSPTLSPQPTIAPSGSPTWDPTVSPVPSAAPTWSPTFAPSLDVYDPFARLTGKACAEDLPYGPQPLASVSGPYLSTVDKDTVHRGWNQIINADGNGTNDMRIVWTFLNETKTLAQRFEDAVQWGERVRWEVYHGSNVHGVVPDVVSTGIWRFSDSAGVTVAQFDGNGTEFSNDDGCWGAPLNTSTSAVNGNNANHPLGYGICNLNSGDNSQCSRYMVHGQEVSDSGSLRAYMYLDMATLNPSLSPTWHPTISPAPTMSPTVSPAPTSSPMPTMYPTPAPTMSPTISPAPTASPTTPPTMAPSMMPTWLPSDSPTAAPTWAPSVSPAPSASPSMAPSMSPTDPAPHADDDSGDDNNGGDDEDDSGGSSGLSDGEIAGIAVGSIVGFALVIGIAFFFLQGAGGMTGGGGGGGGAGSGKAVAMT